MVDLWVCLASSLLVKGKKEAVPQVRTLSALVIPGGMVYHSTSFDDQAEWENLHQMYRSRNYWSLENVVAHLHPGLLDR